jgi:hypothetical protein
MLAKWNVDCSGEIVLTMEYPCPDHVQNLDVAAGHVLSPALAFHDARFSYSLLASSPIDILAYICLTHYPKNYKCSGRPQGTGHLTEDDINRHAGDSPGPARRRRFKVVKRFVAAVRRAMSAEVLESLTPGQQVVRSSTRSSAT